MSNTDKTKEVLYEMLRENTGRHMLDSGGAYGRHFEANKDKDFEKLPYLMDFDFEIHDNGHIGFGATINLYQFLYERLDYCESVDKEFYKFVETLPEDMVWEDCLEKFCKEYNYNVIEAVNSYNYESDLSQVIMFWVLENESGDYPDVIILRIHNGCDVRGGYTSPRFFEGSGAYGTTDEGAGLHMSVIEGLLIRCNGDSSNIDSKILTLNGMPEKPKYHEWEIMAWDNKGSVYIGDGDGKPLEELDVKITGEIYDKKIECPYCNSTTSIYNY